jgi:thiamine biosynthesis lipoprotein
MGSDFELVLLCETAESAKSMFQVAIDEIQRIENLLSEFKPDSETALINASSGTEPVQVSEEVYKLIKRSIQLSEISQGAFDISIGALKSLYQFKNADFQLPPIDVLNRQLLKTGFKKVQLLKDCHVFLPVKGMALTFAGIGKGYAADRVKELWLANDVGSGVISASGDMCVIGKNEHDLPWQIGIAHPDSPNQNIANIPMSNGAIATSGDYEQYFMYNNKRFSHTINPLSGWPCLSLKSVSVVSPSAELSDALATAVYVMGIDNGLHMINQLPNTHALIVDEFNTIHLSEYSIFEHAS